MEGVPESIAHLLRALRPAGLWYGALSAVVAFSVWCLQDKTGWMDWPAPIRCAMWSWLVATVLAVPYTHLVGAITARIERRSIDALPVAQPPAQLPGGAVASATPPATTPAPAVDAAAAPPT